MRIGIAIEETWQFFNEIHAHLKECHSVSVFRRRVTDFPFLKERINRRLFKQDMGHFFRSNDVVFFEWASGLLADASQLPKGCPVVTRLHRYELYQWANRINWQNVDKVILVSHAMREEFVSQFPTEARKSVVLPPSIPVADFMFTEKRFSGDIGVLCHITPRKRVYDLVLTFYELLQEGFDLRLHLAGGEHREHLDYFRSIQSLCEGLGINEKVIQYGHVETPKDWYPAIDIFISNSYSEGLQVAPMEAMASGCYCLGHHWKGAEELFPKENLYYTGDELKKKVRQYINFTDVERLAKRRRLRTLVEERFDIEQTQVEIRKEIESLV